MTYNMWVDDQAFDFNAENREAPPDYVPVVNTQQAIIIIKTFGFPRFIDFDHDLGIDIDGMNDTAMHLLYKLDRMYDLSTIKAPDYRIHSANPEGAKNIQAFMESWKRVTKDL